jgi:CDP-6-deoxy-D-xylo-4-hexulose-3-dehydrase
MFANWQWRSYCVFFNSGSSANLALIQAMINMWRFKKWDKIAFSSLSRATNPMPLIQLWLEPIPLDVELETLNVSLSTLKKALEKHNIKGLFITNLLGWCDHSLADIEKYCHDNDIIILEDNCESMGTIFQWKKLWNYSLASTFSTYVGHHMSTIEGWMVCTDDSELYDMLLMTRAHGRDRNMTTERQQIIREKNAIDWFYSKYTFYTLWYNLRPNEITWFLGCEQLQYLDTIIQIREKNAKQFIESINNNNDFYPLRIEHIDLFSNFALPIICKSKEILWKYIKKFTEANVEIRPIVWWDLTQQIFWKTLYGESDKDTNANLIHQQWFYFGNSPEYTKEEIDILLNLIS